MSAPKPSPSQKLRKLLLPPLRLKNGLMNASDEELEYGAELCERWTLRCAGVLILGLLVELGLAYCEPSHESYWGRWGTFWATCLVVAGVWGEVAFGRMGARRQGELTQRAKKALGEANARAAEANDRAAKAELELAKITRPREIDDEKLTAFSLSLKPFAGQEFDITTFRETKEPFALASRIYAGLVAAGWTYVRPANPGMPFPGTEGVVVWLHPDADESAKKAREGLLVALAVADIMAVPNEMNPQSPKMNKIALSVGMKPR